MKITFYSNYLNHHQLPLCEAFMELCEGQFKFVAEDPITPLRLKLGYEDMNKKDFVVRAYESKAAALEAEKLAEESDIIILGAAKDKYINIRSRLGLPSFKYSERIFKHTRSIFPYRFWRGLHIAEPVWLLCAGAFAAGDYAKAGAYRGKCYKWGYFPEAKEYEDFDEMISAQKASHILWAGRFIDWKRPEAAVCIAERLKADGYDFTINMIGAGEKLEEIKKLAAQKGLEKEIKFLGAVAPEKVREYMESSPIFLLTSNRREGWGAVLNEAMNSGCTVAASHLIGSVPFLLKDGENGMIYRDGDCEDLYKKVKYMLDNPEETARMGKAAYKTIAEQWNAKNAAARFIELAQAIIEGEPAPDIFADGVCSKAKTLKSDWHSTADFKQEK